MNATTYAGIYGIMEAVVQSAVDADKDSPIAMWDRVIRGASVEVEKPKRSEASGRDATVA